MKNQDSGKLSRNIVTMETSAKQISRIIVLKHFQKCRLSLLRMVTLQVLYMEWFVLN